MVTGWQMTAGRHSAGWSIEALAQRSMVPAGAILAAEARPNEAVLSIVDEALICTAFAEVGLDRGALAAFSAYGSSAPAGREAHTAGLSLQSTL